MRPVSDSILRYVKQFLVVFPMQVFVCGLKRREQARLKFTGKLRCGADSGFYQLQMSSQALTAPQVITETVCGAAATNRPPKLVARQGHVVIWVAADICHPRDLHCCVATNKTTDC